MTEQDDLEIHIRHDRRALRGQIIACLLITVIAAAIAYGLFTLSLPPRAFGDYALLIFAVLFAIGAILCLNKLPGLLSRYVWPAASILIAPLQKGRKADYFCPPLALKAAGAKLKLVEKYRRGRASQFTIRFSTEDTENRPKHLAGILPSLDFIFEDPGDRDLLVDRLKAHIPVKTERRDLDAKTKPPAPTADKGPAPPPLPRRVKLEILASRLFLFLCFALLGGLVSMKGDLLRHACLPLPVKSVTAPLTRVEVVEYRVDDKFRSETVVYLLGYPAAFYIDRRVKEFAGPGSEDMQGMATIHYVGETLQRWHEPKTDHQRQGVYILGLAVDGKVHERVFLRCLFETLLFPVHHFFGLLFTLILPLVFAIGLVRPPRKYTNRDKAAE